MPTKPRLMDDGSYHPVDIDRYLTDCADAGLSPADVSRDLRIPHDRAVYAIGLGRHAIRRRARLAQGGLSEALNHEA